jgi:hypothetical protein
MGIYIVIWFVVRDNNIASLFVLRISERTTNRAYENCEIHRLGVGSQLQTKQKRKAALKIGKELCIRKALVH